MPRGHLYDVFGNVLSVKAGSYTLATYEYAAKNGKLLKLTYGNGDYEEYVYDELERLVQTKLNGVSEYIVKYDNNGRLYSLTEDGATHIYEYDSLDRLIRAWQEDEDGNYVVAVENSYDNLGRAKGSTYVVGDRTMSYEVNYKANSNLVNYVSMPAANLQSNISYTYDEFERVTKKQNSFFSALNFYEEYEYYTYTDGNNVQHTTSLVSSLSFGGNTTSAVYSYIYDKLGNITQIKKDGVLVESYEYDSLGQLTREDNVPANYSVFYSYDKSGNLTKREKFTFSSAPTWHMAAVFGTGTVTSYTYGNSTWGDMLTNYNGTAITYDAIGNPLKWRNSSSLTWEGRTLTAQTLNSDDRLTYSYNSNGIRTQKQFYDYMTGDYRTYNYVLDGTRIIKETVSDPAYNLNYTFYYLYDASGSVQGFIYNNAYYYFQKNLQGDVVRILNSSGTVVVEYTYDAWGKVLTTTGSMASTVGRYNPFRYRGYYYDVETGFYYLQSRYYDPVVGRFLNADGIIGANGNIQGYNLFTYCNNNPISYIDANGYLCTYNREMTDSGNTPDDVAAKNEFILLALRQDVKLYRSQEQAAHAWAEENRKLSKTHERVAAIYEAYGFYYLSETFEGSNSNVIFETMLLTFFRHITDPLSTGTQVAQIHSHPTPRKDNCNDFPSEEDISFFRILSKHFGHNEMYIVPYEIKRSDPIVLASDPSTWNPKIINDPKYRDIYD